jgi:hypothetical protein
MTDKKKQVSSLAALLNKPQVFEVGPDKIKIKAKRLSKMRLVDALKKAVHFEDPALSDGQQYVHAQRIMATGIISPAIITYVLYAGMKLANSKITMEVVHGLCTEENYSDALEIYNFIFGLDIIQSSPEFQKALKKAKQEAQKKTRKATKKKRKKRKKRS